MRGNSFRAKGQVSLEFMILAAALMFMVGILLPAYHGLLGAQSALHRVQSASYYADHLAETLVVLSFSPVGTSRKVTGFSPEELFFEIHSSSIDVVVSLPEGVSPKTFTVESPLPLEDRRENDSSTFFLVRNTAFISLES